MDDLARMIVDWLSALRTPALVLLTVAAVLVYVKIGALGKQIVELKEMLAHKAELQALNNVGAKVSRLEKELGSETSKTRIAVAALAQKADAPQVLQDFLK